LNAPTRVFICSGHMIDAPARGKPRFPPSKVRAVRASIAGLLRRWDVGAHDVGICGGARGADIIFAEECLKLATRVVLLIALPEEEFVARSVRLPGSDWEARYRALRTRCETHFQHEEWGDRHRDIDVFSRNNIWCLEMAYAMVSAERVYGVLVWDERLAGDGPGGTSDFASRIRARGGQVAIVNPTRL
jgi:hypothetical protein